MWLLGSFELDVRTTVVTVNGVYRGYVGTMYTRKCSRSAKEFKGEGKMCKVNY